MLIELEDVLDFVHDEARKAAMNIESCSLLGVRYGWTCFESHKQRYTGRLEACHYFMQQLVNYSKGLRNDPAIDSDIPGQITLRGALYEAPVKVPEFRDTTDTILKENK